MTAELAFERSGPERLFSPSCCSTSGWITCARRRPQRIKRAPGGQGVDAIQPPARHVGGVQDKLVRGESPIVEAALVKELGTTLEQMIPAAIADDLFAREGEDVPCRIAADAEIRDRGRALVLLRAAARATSCAA